jgi:hypothetical protein
LPETPIFDKIEINGLLKFKPDIDVHLRAKKILIRGGELQVGTKEKPYLKNGQITLHGGKDDPTIAIVDQGVEAGNKIIANLGKLTMHGKKRAFKMTRLLKEAKKGENIIHVAPGLDLVQGDRIALVATSFDHLANEDHLVKAYNSDTGALELETTLRFYHWGAPESTGDRFNGVDMRGEVLSLSRNIKIVGEDIDNHGCQLLTAEIMEPDGTMREGETILDSIEMYRCSQMDTRLAAIRFEEAITKFHEVRNCALHNGMGWAVNAFRSKNIVFDNNVFFSFRQTGVGFNEVQSITYNNNFLAHVVDRTSTLESAETLDAHGGLLVCSLSFPKPCIDMKITNNIVAGVVFAGMITPGSTCDEEE